MDMQPVQPQVNSNLLNIGDLFRESWRLFKKKYATLLGLLLVPFGALIASAILVLLLSFLGADTTAFRIFVIVLFVIVGIIFSLWSKAAMFYSASFDGRFKESLRKTWPKVLPFFILELFVLISVLAGFIILIIPGIIFYIWFEFAVLILINENDQGINALAKSKEYVRGNWWPIFGRIFILFLLSLVASLLTKIFPNFIGQILSAIYLLIYSPFSIVYLYVIYKNLRELKPGISVDQKEAKTLKIFVIVGAVLVAVVGYILGYALMNASKNTFCDGNNFNCTSTSNYQLIRKK